MFKGKVNSILCRKKQICEKNQRLQNMIKMGSMNQETKTNPMGLKGPLGATVAVKSLLERRSTGADQAKVLKQTPFGRPCS